MNTDKIQLKEGQTYNGITQEYFNTAFSKKIKGRKMYIERIFTRLGSDQRSFTCIFLPNTKRQKPFEHTFLEFEHLQILILE